MRGILPLNHAGSPTDISTYQDYAGANLRVRRVRCSAIVELSVTRDDVVIQRPEDMRFLVPVFHTPTACAGAATAYLLRRIAYRAGSYAPGIQEYIFHELNSAREGGSIEKVQGWFARRSSASPPTPRSFAAGA